MTGNELKAASARLQQGQTVQVKVCGLTRVDEAVACAQAGARAIGCVFYAKSPRCVSAATARDIRRALPPEVTCVGVFVDEPLERSWRWLLTPASPPSSFTGANRRSWSTAWAARGFSSSRRSSPIERPGLRLLPDSPAPPSSLSAGKARRRAGTPPLAMGPRRCLQ